MNLPDRSLQPAHRFQNTTKSDHLICFTGHERLPVAPAYVSPHRRLSAPTCKSNWCRARPLKRSKGPGSN